MKKSILMFLSMIYMAVTLTGCSGSSAGPQTTAAVEDGDESESREPGAVTESAEPEHGAKKAKPEGGMGHGIAVRNKGDREKKIETDPEITAVIDAGKDKFIQSTFEDEQTGITLEYSLYVPEDYDENQSYPMIMYIPDASGASKSAKEIVEQYYGANV